MVSETLPTPLFPFSAEDEFPSASLIPFDSGSDLLRSAPVEGPGRVLESFGSFAGEGGSRVAGFHLDPSGSAARYVSRNS